MNPPDTKTCLECGDTYTRPPRCKTGDWNARTYCSRSCGTRRNNRLRFQRIREQALPVPRPTSQPAEPEPGNPYPNRRSQTEPTPEQLHAYIGTPDYHTTVTRLRAPNPNLPTRKDTPPRPTTHPPTTTP